MAAASKAPVFTFCMICEERRAEQEPWSNHSKVTRRNVLNSAYSIIACLVVLFYLTNKTLREIYLLLFALISVKTLRSTLEGLEKIQAIASLDAGCRTSAMQFCLESCKPVNLEFIPALFKG